MIIAADIGNSNIKFGIFDGSAEKLICSFSVSASAERTADEFLLTIKSFLSDASVDCSFEGSVISSVVPSITTILQKTFTTLCNRDPLIVGAGIKTGFKISIDVQSEMGADIVSNVVESFNAVSAPFAVVDMGTATTISVVDRNNTLIGAIIAPGCGISLKALSDNAALLCDVSLNKPTDIIGKNSLESITSGIYNGNIYMIDGFLRDIRAKVCKDGEKLGLVATGGYTSMLDSSRNKFCIDDKLTLRGAARLYYNNVK